jgi:stage II sporulation protein M
MLPEKALKPYLLILSLLFVASFLVGVVVVPAAKAQAATIYQAIAEALGELPGGSLFVQILMHNFIAALLIIVLGSFFGIIPVLAICGNGFVLGLVFRLAADTVGYAEASVRILPHGLLEIPALLISSAYGLWIGVNAIRRVRKIESEPLGNQMRYALRRFLVIVLPLLIVAAAIETALILMQ